MCGIAGIAGRKEEAAPLLGAMLDAMPYRGPDDRGVESHGEACLGQLRLSIIDTSSCGHQPMPSHDGRYVIVFNGEIFNYLELRDELRAMGCSFATPGDTEVILESYRVWGEDCVSHFNGMWAFALWDKEARTLFCARDRFGVKPFFYAVNGRELLFASEMKGLLAAGRHEPDWQYLYHFFDRRTPLGCDRTVFKGILHLRPGHTLTWKDGDVSIRRFWAYDPGKALETYDYTDPAATFRELFFSAVKLRLRSDVPLGICLSGGIDSSAIAVVMKELGVSPHTFSSVYAEPGYGEAEFIDAVNAQVGATPHRITPRHEDFFAVMEKIVRHHDEPVRMPGVYSHWHVMECAAPHVTVLLDGQGADEIVGGYDDYFPSYVATLLRAGRFAEVRRTLAALRKEKGMASAPVLKEALLRAMPSVRGALGGEKGKDAIFSRVFVERFSAPIPPVPEEVELLARARTPLDEEMYKTFRETNLPMLLRYEDRNSMAFSLEARTPFLDYRIVDFCSGLPPEWKMKGAVTKRVVREALKDLLPKSVLERRDKKGFPTPAAVWMRGPLKDGLRTRLLDGALASSGVVDVAAVTRLLDEHTSGKANRERSLFRLLTMDIWMRQHPEAQKLL